MKRRLLVTLADQNYIKQAKQLIAGVYFNSGWKGDYMLLAYQIPSEELQWFIDKGILIEACQPLIDAAPGYPPVVFSKCYLFQEKFKHWNQIVYLDADILVRNSISLLGHRQGFNAIRDMSFLQEQSKDKKFFLRGKAFCTGIMAFTTDMIRPDSFSRLKQLCQEYKDISAYGEQLAFNLYFYKQWKELPIVYGMFIYEQKNKYKIPLKNIQSIMLHIVSSQKPWNKENYFYNEWNFNLQRADLIDLTKPIKPKQWSKTRIIFYIIYLNYRYLVYNILDKYLGLTGNFLRLLKNICVKIYYQEKNNEKRIHNS